MKLEDKSCVELVRKGQLGKVTFIRYTLILENIENYEKVLSEFYSWSKMLVASEVISISVSHVKNKKGILITGKYSSEVMFNIFIAENTFEKGFIKKVEVVGTKGLYMFNSETEEAFTSTCIKKKKYDYLDLDPENEEWIDQIKKELLGGR